MEITVVPKHTIMEIFYIGTRNNKLIIQGVFQLRNIKYLNSALNFTPESIVL